MDQCCNHYTAINSCTLNNFPVYDDATNNYSYTGDTNIHCIYDKNSKIDDCFYIGLIFKTYKPFIISLGHNTGQDDQLHVYANEYWFKKLFFDNINNAQGITKLEKGMICELWCIQSYKITDIKTGRNNNSDLEEFWEVALLNIVNDPKDIDYLIRENAGVTSINSILEKINNKIR
ncbi:uncharacterized protein SCDLUD_000565 [Saccharomycodes ludwigii]|uniref:uncharacterized protein n=1 Tax=Saccharomycodes ludwigii TaxID=36035 RepID=UPI001E8550E7|nr:hypothetical protein SCDLUD_000565 [Saccharomycodes ludwigii]KAH3902965.1 hypothetical protein SCDLUD_000565 [Saccharomycodes ludwigii]